MAAIQRRHILAGVIALVVAVALVVFLLAHKYGDQLPPLEETRAAVSAYLEDIPPLVYLLAFVVLPALGVPLSIFYLTAIPVLGQAHPAIGILLGWLAVALNMCLTSVLARSLLHPAIEWFIRHRHMTIPKIKPKSEWKIVVATRLSPVPFFLQNYLLALGHARWRYYLGLSMLIQGSIGLAVMLVGESILSGGLGFVLLALFVFLLLNLLFDFIRNRLNVEQPATK